jgi:hypothetical protein
MLNFAITLLIVSIFLLLVSIVLLIVLFIPKEKHLNYKKDGGGSKIKLFMESNFGNVLPLPDGEYKVEGGSTEPTQKHTYFSLRKKLVDLKREATENGLTKECESEIQKLTEELKEIERSTQQIYDNQAWKRHQ